MKCKTCGDTVEHGRCTCWTLLADALQRFTGMDYDGSAQMAADLWEDGDKVYVWSGEWDAEHPAQP